jgi:2-polyprenyl-3-methyl-5-hydroxy-6-metoxy-1,4-benzoquinol methylase
MHAPKSGIDVEQLKELIRCQVRINKRRVTPDAKTSLPRFALDLDRSFSEAFQFHLNDGGDSHLGKLASLRERGREKTEVSRWIPKPFRRWFRKQGGFNKIILESLRVIEKTQRSLIHKNGELRAYLSAHYYWFRDFVERRVEDREMINDLHATSVAHERASRRIQTQIDRQAKTLQSTSQLSSSLLEQLELEVKRSDHLKVEVHALQSQAEELRLSLKEETHSRDVVFAELTAKLEQEGQARGRALAELLAKVDHQIAESSGVSAQTAQLHSEFTRKLAELEAQIRAEAKARDMLGAQLDSANISWTAGLNALQDSLRRSDERQLNESAYFKAELLLQQERVHDQRAQIDPTTAKSRAQKVTSNDNGLSHRFDAFYLAFENRFRGPREEIKSRFTCYLPHLARLRGAKNSIRILDVGCGRGEWMELLKENDYNKVSGVDSNVVMAAQCAERGLTVTVRDGVEHISSLKTASLNVITAFHVIEHLAFEQLMRLLTQCHRVLKRGGLLILETPNPDNLIVAAKNFYTDPTHLRPLPSVLTAFLAEHAGFTDVTIVNQHPFNPDMLAREPGELAQRFNELFCSEQDYSTLARKP